MATIGKTLSRRDFIKKIGLGALTLGVSGCSRDNDRSDGSSRGIIQVVSYPNVRHANGGFETLESKLILFGGGSYWDSNAEEGLDGVNRTNMTEIYGPRGWIGKRPMLKAIRYMATFTLDRKVYSVCGEQSGKPCTNEVFEYNPEKNAWKQMNNFQLPLADLLVTVLNGVPYAMGGRNEQGYTNDKVFKYDKLNDEWLPIDLEMPIPVKEAAILPYQGKIYVLGGLDTKPSSKEGILNVYPIDKVQIYTPGGGWEVKEMLHLTGSMQGVILGDEFILFSEYYGHNHIYGYSPATGKLSRSNKFETPSHFGFDGKFAQIASNVYTTGNTAWLGGGGEVFCVDLSKLEMKPMRNT